jgi:hypothetical protein
VGRGSFKTDGVHKRDTASRHSKNNEMLKGLKKYMELELFPRVHMKVGRGISLNSARCWLQKEGFKFISHQKGLYFDGHDRPDVVKYQQEVVLKTMEIHSDRIVQYVVGSVEKEVEKHPSNFVERRVVLCAHDEMTAQANDSRVKSWVFEDQHSLCNVPTGRLSDLDARGCLCHISSRTGRVSRAFHTDYHWDRLRSYFVLPSHARRLVAVMCRVL